MRQRKLVMESGTCRCARWGAARHAEVNSREDQSRQAPVFRNPPPANRGWQALKLAAMSLSRSDSALAAFYRWLCVRMDDPCANTAMIHKLVRMVY